MIVNNDVDAHEFMASQMLENEDVAEVIKDVAFLLKSKEAIKRSNLFLKKENEELKTKVEHLANKLNEVILSNKKALNLEAKEVSNGK